MSCSRFRTRLVVRHRVETTEKAALDTTKCLTRDIKLATAVGNAARPSYVGGIIRSQFARVRLGEIRTHVRTH